MERPDLVLRGGTLGLPDGPRVADLAVAKGRVAAVGQGLPGGAVEVDARGLWVLPGALDAHVHSRDPGFPEKEDWGSLTAAAAAGGVTTVIDMPNTVPVVDSAALLQEKAAIAARRALVDFGLWGLLRRRSTGEDVRGLLEAGAIGLKAYLASPLRLEGRRLVAELSDGPGLEAPPDYGCLARLAPELAARGAPLAVHAEDWGVLRAFSRPVVAYADLLAARPAVAESVAVAALGAVSRATDVRVHVVHLSSAAGLAAATAARAAGARLTLETTPQHLWLSDQDAERLGGVLKMYAPVRWASDRRALVTGLLNGAIQVVATDHAPHTDAEKLAASLAEVHPGTPGVQTLYLSCLELARRHGDPWRAVAWASEGPARLLGLYPRKGSLEPGADADVALIDPAGETVVSAGGMWSRQRHGALDGQRFAFSVRSVWSRGELVAAGGRPAGPPGRGRLVRPRLRPG